MFFSGPLPKKQAEHLGLSGWVKNTEEGDVTCVVSGATNDVNRFIRWCRQGPSGANVTDIVIYRKEPEKYSSFTIIR